MNRRVMPAHLQVVQKATAAPIAAPAAKPAQGDWLYGTEAIALFMEFADPRLVYRIKESGAPIGKLPGIGLAARKSELDVWRNAHVAGLVTGARSA